MLNVSFLDLDLDLSDLGGKISWEPPLEASQVTHYLVYLAANASGAGRSMVGSEVPYDSLSTLLDAETPRLDRDYVVVYTRSYLVESTTPSHFPISDAYSVVQVNFTDKDLDDSQIGGTISWTTPEPDFNPLVSFFTLHLADDAFGFNRSQIGSTMPWDLQEAALPPEVYYDTATHFVVFTGSTLVEQTTPSALAIYDTDASVSNITFQDKDLDESEMGGDIFWDAPLDADQVTYYAVFIGPDPLGQRSQVAGYGPAGLVPAGVEQEFINADTSIGTFQEVVVYTRSSLVEQSTAVALPIVDEFATVGSIHFMDIDQDIDMLGGEFSWVPPNDTSEVAFYVGYFANTPGMLDSGSRRFEFEILGHLNSYDLPFQTPQSGYSYFSIYTKSSLAEQTTPNSVEVIDFCQNVPTLENQSLYVEEGVHLLDIYDVPEVVITKFTGVSEDGLSLEFAPLRRGPVYMIITDIVAVAGMTNTDVQSLANALGGPNCRIPGNLMVSCTNITFQLYGCSLSVGGSFNYRLWLLQEDGETGTIGEAAYIDFIVASVVFDQGPFIYFRNASSVALQYIPSHEGFEWMYAVPTAGGYADQVLLGDDRIMWVRRVKSMYLASEGRKCQNARVPIFGKEAKISFLYDCEFTLGQEYRIFILLEDGFNRHDGTLKTVDFVYQGEMTVNSAIPYSHPVPSATRWRLVPLSLVSTEWKVQHLQMFSDVTCSRRVAAYPAPYRDLLLSTWDEGQPLPTGFPFSDPGPLPLESLFEDGRMGPGFLSGRPCGPGDCHIGFSFGSGLSGANDVNVAVKVGCVEVMQSDASGEFAESLELQYYDGSQYVSYRQAFNLAGGISFVPTFNGTVGLHVDPR